MLTALILVCSLAVTPELRDCNRNNAVRVAQLPEQVQLPLMCLKLGEEFLAQTSFGQDIQPGEAIKVLCISENRPANVG